MSIFALSDIGVTKTFMSKQKYGRIYLRVSPFEEKQFIRLKEEHGLSARQVLELSGCPCDKCKGVNVIAYDRVNGEPIEIPRGILTKRNR